VSTPKSAPATSKEGSRGKLLPTNKVVTVQTDLSTTSFEIKSHKAACASMSPKREPPDDEQRRGAANPKDEDAPGGEASGAEQAQEVGGAGGADGADGAGGMGGAGGAGARADEHNAPAEGGADERVTAALCADSADSSVQGKYHARI